jgi:Co-chaperonin GroES (HSP10)
VLKLLDNKIAAIPIFDPDQIGHIIIPSQAKERCDQGIVKYIGPNVKEIKIGDYILFSGYTGTLLDVEDEGTVIILPEDFVTATIEDFPDTSINGLYFKGADGDYFPATYEMMMKLAADEFRNKKWRMDMLVRAKFSNKNKFANKPKLEDYNKLR